MRISDWSSDVGSSDLSTMHEAIVGSIKVAGRHPVRHRGGWNPALRWYRRRPSATRGHGTGAYAAGRFPDRKSVVEGTSVSVRVDLGGRRIIKQKDTTREQNGVTAKQNKVNSEL